MRILSLFLEASCSYKSFMWVAALARRSCSFSKTFCLSRWIWDEITGLEDEVGITANKSRMR